MSQNISIDRMAESIEKELLGFRRLATDGMKMAVKKAGKTARSDINKSAPVRTGRYAKSWKDKVTEEDSQRIHVTVFSPSRYMIAHLLEYGHAMRGGGRVRAIPHIKPAEEHAEEVLLKEIGRALEGLENDL